MGVHWKDGCWSWNSNTSATRCKELTHWKRPWCWEGLGAGGEGDNWEWYSWMASLTRLTWVWVDSGSWWWTESPGVLRFMGSQRVVHGWATELNWMLISSSKILRDRPWMFNQVQCLGTQWPVEWTHKLAITRPKCTSNLFFRLHLLEKPQFTWILESSIDSQLIHLKLPCGRKHFPLPF